MVSKYKIGSFCFFSLLFLPCFQPYSFSFRSLQRIRDTYQFSKKVFDNYGYDRSHGIGHAVDVTKYANDIFEFHTMNNPNKKKIKEIIIVCSLLHDTIDKKYSPETTEFRTKCVQRFLLHDLEYEPLVVMNIMRIMKTMSYSLTVHNCSSFHPPLWIKKEDEKEKKSRLYPWSLIYHTVRQADLLTSYDVERMLSYKYYNIDKNISFVLEDTKEMFETRISSLTTIPDLFPSSWALTESKRLLKICGIMMDILMKDQISIVAPFQFSKYRTLENSHTLSLSDLFQMLKLSSSP
uniref:HD/PDEase domain-containing protein n=1 Tax=viral metagenome TaxID=1070528 RepID=A0A6C0D040_9ZZZZ